MAQMIVIYKTPENKEVFDKHYFEVHIPMAKKLPGLRKYEVSESPIISTAGDRQTYQIGTLYFDSLEDMNAAIASAQGKACAADRRILVPDDEKIQIYLFDTIEI